jgi:hypothetical protein
MHSIRKIYFEEEVLLQNREHEFVTCNKKGEIVLFEDFHTSFSDKRALLNIGVVDFYINNQNIFLLNEFNSIKKFDYKTFAFINTLCIFDLAQVTIFNMSKDANLFAVASNDDSLWVLDERRKEKYHLVNKISKTIHLSFDLDAEFLTCY